MADPYYRLRARVKSRSLQQVRDAAEALGRKLDDVVPVATGELKRSQKITVTDSETRTSVNITYEAPYWKITDQGSPRHEIFPKESDMLRFIWVDGPAGTKWYEFDMVNHPGQKGTRWYSDTINSANWSEALSDSYLG